MSDGPNKIFVGGIPKQLNEEHIKEILGAFGDLKAFNLVRDIGNTTESKGYAFCEYVDHNITSAAIEGLNGLMVLDKPLTVRVATSTSQPSGPKTLPGLS